MKYHNYTSIEFAHDSFFRAWVKHPENIEIAGYWELFLQKNPQQYPAIQKAWAMVLEEIESKIHQKPLLLHENHQLWQRIQHSVANKPIEWYNSPKPTNYTWQWVASAAIFFLISIVFWNKNDNSAIPANFQNPTMYDSRKAIKVATLKENIFGKKPIVLSAKPTAEYLRKSRYLPLKMPTHQISLAALAHKIQNRFGLRIIFPDSTVAKQKITATIIPDDLNALLSIVRQSSDFKITPASGVSMASFERHKKSNFPTP